MIPPHSNNGDLENALDHGPDLIAKALEDWRMATFNRKKKEALLYAKYKLEDKERNITEIKHLISTDPEFFPVYCEEVKSESEYMRLYEKHMANKKKADLRTAF